ncbi:MAG: hypothetical protein HOQ43_14185 [Glycomyces artemisiae]|uniref:Uncharacterized protein n=1 Tax=Glycomyces artemisiae TaxID=1076443 RepID=A0A850CCB6_9ACTN|nr:hypothetical protein [Glycomyces artemisiae]
MSAVDPYYVAAWDDPIGKQRATEAENAQLRARVAELEAELERLDTSVCHATIHDGRDGRLGLRSLWTAWFGPKAVRP